jgi:hypothetical protein
LPTRNERWLNVVRNLGLDLTKPVNIINTSDIAKYGGIETRRMVSIDEEKENPEIFRRHDVFLAPLSRTKVAIIRGKGFERLEEIRASVRVHRTDYGFPDFLRKSRGESNFLQYAFNSGLLSEFTGRPKLRAMYSAKGRAHFAFNVDGHGPFLVEGAQYELDQSYGDEDSFFVVEAKYGIPESFNIRQLYYPYRVFLPEVKPRDVRSLFFAYEPGLSEYRFWEYTFSDPGDYEKIELVRSERYRVEVKQDPKGLEKLEVKPIKMEAIQANNVFFLMDIPSMVFDGIDDTQKIADQLGIVEREGRYYRDAMIILGFIVKRGQRSVLTSLGEEYLSTPVSERTRFFLDRVIEYPPVAEIIKRILEGERIDSVKRREIIERMYGSRISGDTVKRRADCLRKFFEFIAEVRGYCKVENGIISMIKVGETLNGFR